LSNNVQQTLPERNGQSPPTVKGADAYSEQIGQFFQYWHLQSTEHFRGTEAVHWRNWYIVLARQPEQSLPDDAVLIVRTGSGLGISFKNFGNPTRNHTETITILQGAIDAGLRRRTFFNLFIRNLEESKRGLRCCNNAWIYIYILYAYTGSNQETNEPTKGMSLTAGAITGRKAPPKAFRTASGNAAKANENGKIPCGTKA